MREFQEKRKWRSVLYSWGTILVLLLGCIVVGRGAVNMFNKYIESGSNLDSAKKELAGVEAREKIAKDKIAALNTEEGVDEELRSRFNVTKGGEGMIVMVPATNSASDTAEQFGFWQKIWYFVSSLWN